MMLNVHELFLRVAAIQIESLAALSTPVIAEAKPFFIYQQESFPYFTNRLGAGTSLPDGEDLDADMHTVLMRLIIGHVTEGYVGDLESNLQTYSPQIKTYFNKRQQLQSVAYPLALTDLIYARVVNWTGLLVWQTVGISAHQVGEEFTLEVHMNETITPAFY